jgi:DNA-binding MarR family transcriptional regulator
VTAVDEDLVTAVHRLGRLMGSRQVSGRITTAAGVDLSQQGLQVLRTLHRHGELPVAALAARADMQVPAVSRQLGELERLGMVRRTSTPGDARVALISLTDPGTAVADRIREISLRHLDASLRAWPEEDRRALGRLLGRLVDDLQRTPVVPG